MFNDYRILAEPEMILEKKIIIYGCGSSGQRLFQLMEILGCNIIGFCDSDVKKKGKKFVGVNVWHKSDLPSMLDGETIIIVASVFYDEIIKELTDIVEGEVVFTKYAFGLSLWLNYKSMNFELRDVILEYMENWKKMEFACMEDFCKKESIKHQMALYHNSVLIYQPGKTGSMSLWRTCESYGISSVDVHILNPYSSNIRYIEWCQQACKRFQGKIIVPIREPIARDISNYFQLLALSPAIVEELFDVHEFYEGFHKIYYDYLIKENETEFNGYPITNDAYNYRREGYVKYGYEFDFFEIELKRYFGIDVMKHSFDTQKGYSIIKEKGIEILLIQLEKMNELEGVVGEFLNIPNFKLNSTNVGSEKEYRYLYQIFKSNIKMKQEYVDFYYKNNVAMEHFYSEDQRNHFYNKWLKYM